jgi:gliding motility-associated-like protein
LNELEKKMRIRSNILTILLITGLLSVKAQGDLPLACAGSMVRYGVDGLPNSVFEWTVTGGEIIANYNDSIDIKWGSDPGNYSIQVIEHAAGECSASPYIADITIDKASVDIGDFVDICRGDTGLVILQGDYASFEWSDSNIDGPIFPVSEAGKVWVDVVGTYDCRASDTVEVAVHDLPDVYLGEDIELCGDEHIILDAGSDGITYNWSVSGYNSRELEVGAGVQRYHVKVVNIYGCENSDTINILACFPYEELKKSIPTAFTPNGDGKNDEFLIPGIEKYPNAEIEVFDRWGRMVYKSGEGYFEPWDGTFRGDDLPTDSYFYVIDLKEGLEPIAGSISIFRGDNQQ